MRKMGRYRHRYVDSRLSASWNDLKLHILSFSNYYHAPISRSVIVARYKILSQKEELAFEACPVLSPVQRYRTIKKLQDFPGFRKSSQSMSKENKVHFFLTAVYYIFSGKFYYASKATKDFDYCYRILNNENSPKGLSYNKSSFTRHKTVILKRLGHRPFDSKSYDTIYSLSKKITSTKLDLKDAFYSLVDAMREAKVEVPSVFKLQEILLRTLNDYEFELGDHCSKVEEKYLLELEDLISPATMKNDKRVRYKISTLKNISHSKKSNDITDNARIHKELGKYINAAEIVIKKTMIGNESINYFSTFIFNEDVKEIIRKKGHVKYLYLACFVIYQYGKIQDHFIKTLFDLVGAALTSARNNHRDDYYELRKKKGDITAKIVNNYDQFEGLIGRSPQRYK